MDRWSKKYWEAYGGDPPFGYDPTQMPPSRDDDVFPEWDPPYDPNAKLPWQLRLPLIVFGIILLGFAFLRWSQPTKVPPLDACPAGGLIFITLLKYIHSLYIIFILLLFYPQHHYSQINNQLSYTLHMDKQVQKAIQILDIHLEVLVKNSYILLQL